MQKVQNDKELLSMLIDDMDDQKTIWKPTNYWRGYCKRITSELSKVGLEGFRSNWNIIKGYTLMNATKRDVLGATKKGRAAKLLMKIPPFNKIDYIYNIYINGLISNANYHIEKSNLMLFNLLATSDISKDILSRAEDSCVGKPYYLDIKGKRYTPNILQQICMVSILSHMQKLSEINKIIEIGGGYGAFCEIITKLKTNDTGYFVLVDIPPVLYISTQYLKAAFPGKVVDYRQAKELKVIKPSDIENKILVIPPWLLPRLKLDFDLLWNSASFQEMEKDVVENYLDVVCGSTKNVFITSLHEGHQAKAGRQKEKIPFSFIAQKLVDKGYISEIFDKDCAEKQLFDITMPGYDIGYFSKKI